MGPSRASFAVTVVAVAISVLSAAPAAADTAYSNLFTIDLRTPPASSTAYCNLFTIDLRGAAVQPLLDALNDLDEVAVARVDADRDQLAGALAYLFLVMDGKPGAEAISEFVSGSKISVASFKAASKYIAEGSKAAGDFTNLGGAVFSNLLVNYAVQRAEESQAEYFRSVLGVLDGLWGTKDLTTVRDAIRARLDQNFSWGGKTLGFDAMRQSIHSSIAGLKSSLTSSPLAASFPTVELTTLVSLAAQSLRDTTGRESSLVYFDGADYGYTMTLSGSAAKYAAAAKALLTRIGRSRRRGSGEPWPSARRRSARAPSLCSRRPRPVGPPSASGR